MKLFYPKPQSLITFSIKMTLVSTSILAAISLALYIFFGLQYSLEQKKQEVSNYVKLLSLTESISPSANIDIWNNQKKVLLESNDTITSIDYYNTSDEIIQPEFETNPSIFGFLTDEFCTIKRETAVVSWNLKSYVVIQIDLSKFRQQWLIQNTPFLITLISVFIIASLLISKLSKEIFEQTVELDQVAHRFIENNNATFFNGVNTQIDKAITFTEFKSVQQAFVLLAKTLETTQQEMDELKLKLKTNLERQEKGFYRQFQRMITRELNKTVSSVSTGVKILRQQYLGEEQQDALSIVRNGSIRLGSILEQSLLFDKIENDQIEMDLIEFNSLQLFSDVIDDYKTITERENLELLHEVSHQNHVLEGDVDNIKTILGILLDNAVKYTQKGSIELKSHMQHFDSSTRWTIRVIDTGIGIEEEYWDDIFMPFFQIDNQINKRQEGIGLGLTLAKKLTELMGGNLSIRSEPGKGCDFELILSMMDKKQIMARNQLSGLNIVIHQTQDGDEIDLSSMGGKAKVIYDLEQTISYSVENRIDVLIINSDVSEAHVMKISHAIRAQETVHRSLICWLSHSEKHPIHESTMQSSGIDMILTKPYNHQTIADTIKQWF